MRKTIKLGKVSQMDRKELNKKDWINYMVKELDTEEKLRDDLECYYNLIQVNSELITILSNNLLSKPNYTIDVFKEFLEKYVNGKIYERDAIHVISETEVEG